MAESEALERLRGRVEETVEYTPLHATPTTPAHAPRSPAFPRSESCDSADRYLPNLASPSDSVVSPLPAIPSGLPGDNVPSPSHLSSSPLTETAPSPLRSNSSSSDKQHTPLHSSKSHNPHADTNGFDKPHPPTLPPSGMKTLLAQANSVPPESSNGSDHYSALDEEELSRLKLNSRRQSRTEKRYHTADAIQEFKQQENKDASIHKRLSWRTDVPVDRNLTARVFSSDSVRSAPSSSGVSSTGSLHLNPEVLEEEAAEARSFHAGGVSTFQPGGVGGFRDPADLVHVHDSLGAELRGCPKSKSTPDLLESFK